MPGYFRAFRKVKFFGVGLLARNEVGKKIVKGAFTVVLMSLLAKLASFVLEAALAATLGASGNSDAYYMVIGVHDVIFPMLSVGVWKIFLPLYKTYNSTGRADKANAMADLSITFFTGITVLFSFCLFFMADIVVALVAPGFDAETHGLCVKLIRISAPMYICVVASTIYASMLQSRRKFMASQIRQTASHIPSIIGALFLYQYFGLEALAVMLVLGSIARLAVELPFVDWGYKYRPNFSFRDEDFKGVLKRLPSALISEGIVQINVLIDKILASGLPVGSVSYLNYGHKLMNVFSGLLSSAVVTSMYPQIVEFTACQEKDRLSKLINKTILLFAILMIPISLGCMLYSTELVTLVFQRGSFSATATVTTASVFSFYCIALFFNACNAVTTSVFYAAGDTKTPMYISFANMLTNVALNIALSSLLGVKGLALATSCAAIINFYVLLYLVRARIELDIKGVNLYIFKLLILAVGIAYPISYGIKQLIFQEALRLGAGLLLSLAIYIPALKMLGFSEIDDLIKLVKNKLKRKKAN